MLILQAIYEVTGIIKGAQVFQFPAVYGRAVYFADRHMDAEDRGGLVDL